jgi:hypothetical protein
VVQGVVKIILEAIFEADFCPSSMAWTSGGALPGQVVARASVWLPSQLGLDSSSSDLSVLVEMFM